MPIYEYECTSCNERFEVRRGIDDDDKEISCPKCKTAHPKRTISLFGSPGASGSIHTPSGSG